jgi:anhydro-N-acetylmuramic acid kinase
MASTHQANIWEDLWGLSSKTYRAIIGLMSGTSADGVTACAVKIAGSYTQTEIKVLGSRTYPYSKELRAKIFELFDSRTATVDAICSMNFALGREFAKAAISLADSLSLSIDEVDLIGSHGQTVYHDPRHTGGSSLQIGEPAVIAEMTGVNTISDFRKRDIAAGGEGAPLSPYVDFILFRGRRGIALQNIGGIANLTYLPPACSEEEVIAFDTGPGNMIVDELVSNFTDGALAYDRDGSIALKGEVNKVLLEGLLSEPFFSRPPPKSTGRELFGTRYVERLLHAAGQRGLKKEDLIATATMLTVETMAKAYEEFVLKEGPLDIIYLAGGGAKNRAMVNWLGRRLPDVPMEQFDALGIPSEAREAAYMAVLANEFLMGHASNLPSATGAKRKVILGTLVPK